LTVFKGKINSMKITKRQLRRIIKEEKRKLLREYELHVDAHGNVYDDEGNVDRRGAAFGQRYGGETYLGTSPPWRHEKQPPVPGSMRGKQQKAIEGFLASKSNNFLQSILDQMKAGKSLSDKQEAVMKKILVKNDPTAADLFESIKIIKEEKRHPDPNLAIKDYREWAREYGAPGGPNSSSVLATYIVNQGLGEAEWMEIALGIGLTPRDVGLEVVRQQREYDAGGVLSDEEDFERGFHEGNMPDVWRQILGNCLEK